MTHLYRNIYCMGHINCMYIIFTSEKVIWEKMSFGNTFCIEDLNPSVSATLYNPLLIWIARHLWQHKVVNPFKTSHTHSLHLGSYLHPWVAEMTSDDNLSLRN